MQIRLNIIVSSICCIIRLLIKDNITIINGYQLNFIHIFFNVAGTLDTKLIMNSILDYRILSSYNRIISGFLIVKILINRLLHINKND